MKKAIIYTRTSPDLVSVRTQIVACKLFAKLNGVEVQRICHDPDENNQKVLLDLLRNSKTANAGIAYPDPGSVRAFRRYLHLFEIQGKIQPVGQAYFPCCEL